MSLRLRWTRLLNKPVRFSWTRHLSPVACLAIYSCTWMDRHCHPHPRRNWCLSQPVHPGGLDAGLISGKAVWFERTVLSSLLLWLRSPDCLDLPIIYDEGLPGSNDSEPWRAVSDGGSGHMGDSESGRAASMRWELAISCEWPWWDHASSRTQVTVANITFWDWCPQSCTNSLASYRGWGWPGLNVC